MQNLISDITPLFRHPRFSYNTRLDTRLWDKDFHLDKLVSNALQMAAWNYIVYLQRAGLPISDECIVDIFIHGSSSNYYYDKSSDIDICIVADLSAVQDMFKTADYNKVIKHVLASWHSKHHISICKRGIDFEIVHVKTPRYGPGLYKVGGAYSLMQDKWIRTSVSLSTTEYRNIAYQARNIFKQWRYEYLSIVLCRPLNLNRVNAFLQHITKVRKHSYKCTPLQPITPETMAFRMFRRSGMWKRLRHHAKQLRSSEFCII